MRFMLILKANKDSEAGKMPSEESIAAMVKYNQEQAKAGILIDAAGLYPSSRGARVRVATGGKKTVTDGPFTESKELVGGYWIIEVKSLAEAIEWAKRAPGIAEESGPGNRNRSTRVYCVRMTYRRVTRPELVGAELAPPGVTCKQHRAAVRKTSPRYLFEVRPRYQSRTMQTCSHFGQFLPTLPSVVAPRIFWKLGPSRWHVYQ